MALDRNNSDIPDQPEYGKKWKIENNFGCCPGCGITPPTLDCRMVIQRNTRYGDIIVTEGECVCQEPIIEQNNCGIGVASDCSCD